MTNQDMMSNFVPRQGVVALVRDPQTEESVFDDVLNSLMMGSMSSHWFGLPVPRIDGLPLYVKSSDIDNDAVIFRDDFYDRLGYHPDAKHLLAQVVTQTDSEDFNDLTLLRACQALMRVASVKKPSMIVFDDVDSLAVGSAYGTQDIPGGNEPDDPDAARLIRISSVAFTLAKFLEIPVILAYRSGWGFWYTEDVVDVQMMVATVSGNSGDIVVSTQRNHGGHFKHGEGAVLTLSNTKAPATSRASWDLDSLESLLKQISSRLDTVFSDPDVVDFDSYAEAARVFGIDVMTHDLEDGRKAIRYRVVTPEISVSPTASHLGHNHKYTYNNINKILSEKVS